MFKQLHVLTPTSIPRASGKKLHTYGSPKKIVETIIDEQVVFDDFDNTITKENKEYIDIAIDKVVIAILH